MVEGEKKDGDDTDEFTMNWKRDLKQKIRSRAPIEYSYLTHLAVMFISSCCCCFVERCEARKGWYYRRKRSVAKFNIAREKLNSEVDMKNILGLLRI